MCVFCFAGDANGSKQRHSVYSRKLAFQPDPDAAEPAAATPAKVEEAKIEVVEKSEKQQQQTHHHANKPPVKVSVPQGKSKAQMLHELEDDSSSDSDDDEDDDDDSSSDDDDDYVATPAPTKTAPLAAQKTHMQATAAKAASKVR
jgi:hypothetical protein